MTTTDDIEQKVGALSKYLPKQSRTPEVCPDYSRIQVPLTWGGIWQAPGLDLKLRSLATISAQCVNGWDFGLQHQIRAGLTMGMSPQKIKGIFIQLLFYAGIPATVFGLLQAQKVINERPEWKTADVPAEETWLDTLAEKLARGSALRRQLWGAQANQEVETSLAQRMVPEASDIVDGYNFGEVWGRSDLQPKERMVCVLAALMARGHWGQLRQYIGYALNMGFDRREVCEVISQAGWYRGWPHVEDGLEQAAAVFAERGS
ncbi:MAG TPA: carboxymuconolactone decarboxylase family protein [Dehalococcoidia bacterium]|nr:carboxymuconolactone decarboxylase family protein [Dehalococcoidia bacterium]